MFTISLPFGTDFGWGNVGRALIAEFAFMPDCEIDLHLDDTPIEREALITNLSNETFKPSRHCRVWAPVRVGYGAIESNIRMRRFALNAKHYWDHICCASTWMRNELLAAGIASCSPLVHGVDRGLFHPAPAGYDDGHFLVFSGGKFEFRKGQDIVIRAMEHMMSVHQDVRLICAWGNKWRDSLHTMRWSKLISFVDGTDWRDVVSRCLADSKIDLSRCDVVPMVHQDQMVAYYHRCHIGLFPNRCEGGTNMVAMEAMSSGLPCILSYNSGHLDICDASSDLAIKNHTLVQIFSDREHVADWFEPLLDETIARLEWAYDHRDLLPSLGARASKAMEQFTWSHTAQGLINALASVQPTALASQVVTAV